MVLAKRGAQVALARALSVAGERLGAQAFGCSDGVGPMLSADAEIAREVMPWGGG